jgi:undecaprenyl-diphosphatase
MALALIAWSIAGRRIGVLAVTAAALATAGVGASRIYLGFHYLTDVAGAVLAGLAWLLVVGAALRARPAWEGWRHRGAP